MKTLRTIEMSCWWVWGIFAWEFCRISFLDVIWVEEDYLHSLSLYVISTDSKSFARPTVPVSSKAEFSDSFVGLDHVVDCFTGRFEP